MTERSRGTSRYREFAPTAIATVLPVAGIGLFGWTFTTVYLLYWLDFLTLLVVYGGCSLFAQRPVVVEGRDMRLAWVDERDDDDDWGDLTTPISLSDRLPPVYAQNVRLLLPNLVLGVGLMLAAGGGILNFLNGYPAESLQWLSEFSSLPPSVLLGVVATIGSHCADAYQSYFRPGRYEQMSAHMVLEVPIRPMALLSAASVVGYIVVSLAAVGVTVVVGEAAGNWTLVSLGLGGFLLVKLIVEWGRFRAERVDDPEGIGGWFSPEDPRDDT